MTTNRAVPGPHTWQQVNLTFPDWTAAENVAIGCVAPILTVAEERGLIAGWFFVRKAPCWRIRYQPAGDPEAAQAHLHGRLGQLRDSGHLTAVTGAVYEPEERAFGGPAAMTVAHRLFRDDSKHVLDYLARTAAEPAIRRRRELAIILPSAMLRAAGLDWHEQGDVWATAASHREPPASLPAISGTMTTLMTGTAVLAQNGNPGGITAGWERAFTTAGRDLAGLAAAGQLHRGLRAVLARHILFTWNRHGLPHAVQAVLACEAASAVFGPDPAAAAVPVLDPADRHGR